MAAIMKNIKQFLSFKNCAEIFALNILGAKFCENQFQRLVVIAVRRLCSLRSLIQLVIYQGIYSDTTGQDLFSINLFDSFALLRLNTLDLKGSVLCCLSKELTDRKSRISSDPFP